MKNVVYVFIDASNLWQAQKAKGKFLNYEKIIKYIKEKFLSDELRIFYYTAYPSDGTRLYSLAGRHKFFLYLKKSLDFIVRKKELKRIKISDDNNKFQEKGNMDVEIVIDAMHYLNKYNIAALFTGDSDFLALVTYLRLHNRKVYVFSSRNNISKELRTGADAYFDILKINEDIWGEDLKYRV